VNLAPFLIDVFPAVLTTHAVVNGALLRRPPFAPPVATVSVALLVPARDEATRIAACLRSLQAQRGVPDLEIVVLDDGSTDATAEVVRTTAGRDPRVRLVTGAPLPDGWLGKPHACAQLAALTDAEVLVFVDADVVLDPRAVAAVLTLVGRFDLVSAYPRLVTRTPAERLVQPLLPWLWLTFLPLRAMERPSRPSLTAAGGQFFAVTRAGYERCGGHAAVRDAVLEDLALARALARHGRPMSLVDASALAQCRMYESWTQVRSGYTKSLWAAGGTPAGTMVLLALLIAVYIGPVLAVAVALVTLAAPIPFGGVMGTPAATMPGWLLAGVVGYLLGVAGRAVSAAATGGRTWPDCLAHPVSVAVLAGLTVSSIVGHRQGTLSWRGRRLGVRP
jgi:hypothetical protein